jgi:hypothetical protein
VRYRAAMPRPLVVLALVVTAFVVVAAPPAAAKKYDNCDLLTKKQVSKMLGFKVVETELTRDKTTGAEECEYRTGKYWSAHFEDIDAPFKLQVTTQPLTPELEATFDALDSDPDAEAVDGLGVRAFYTDGDDLVAVVDPLVIQVEVTNISWSGDEKQRYILGPELAAMKFLVPLFQDA